jgi:hypothetical protein
VARNEEDFGPEAAAERSPAGGSSGAGSAQPPPAAVPDSPMRLSALLPPQDLAQPMEPRIPPAEQDAQGAPVFPLRLLAAGSARLLPY